MGRVATNEILNEKILADLLKGETKWTEIAEKYSVDMNYVRSVNGIYRNELSIARSSKGGVVTYYKGSRVSDGKSSPVTKFNINDLSDKELEGMGLSRFKVNK
ncbi:hypothetical protein AS52_00243 [Priestia megaterium Q3]|uniref:Uncharacterized protein n=1 Tax=Priestia megaterium Q3 TaxID=1452722 RepID=A0A806TBM8_PRIMG|nr:hypothetical protein [Priestia megaterium]AKP75264.1 hypothetical protein AS52_00243 [Priestia megaterium Q3]